MIKNVISQIDVICIMPFWIGRNEISFTNLSFTVVFILLIGVVFFVFLYGNQIIPRSFQVIVENTFLNFSISFPLLGGGRFFDTLMHVDVRRLKKNYYSSSLKKRSSIYDNLKDHPFIPNLVKKYDKNDFYLILSNLTTKDKKAFFLASEDVLHPTSNVYLYRDATIIKLDNKIIINNVIFDLNLSETDMEKSNLFFFDDKLNKNINFLIKNQIETQLGENFSFFSFNSSFENKFDSFKNIPD